MHIAKPAKPKFVPPIRTAVSYLNTITETQGPKFEKTPVLEKKLPQSFTEHASSIIFHPTPSDSSYKSLKPSLTMRQKTSSKPTRDISHLKDLKDLKYCRTEPDSLIDSILPIDIEKLKLFLNSTVQPRLKSQRSQVCFRNSCIGNFLDGKRDSIFSSFDDIRADDFGAPTGQQEIISLKEWFKQMKDKYLGKVIEDNSPGKKPTKVKDPARLDEYEIVLKSGLKEFIRQLTALNVDRGQLLLDMIHHVTLFWTGKLELAESNFKQKRIEDQAKIESLNHELNEKTLVFKEKEALFSNEISLIRSENLLKLVEIQSLQETIKKMKAERIYRTKIELQRYNYIIQQFNDFRQSTISNPEDPNHIKIAKALQKKKESLTSLILNKIQLLHSNSMLLTSRLTQEQLIQHAMLSINSDEIFLEKSSQTNSIDFCITRTTQANIPTSSIGVDTEEILDVVIEEELRRNFENPEKVFNIFVTNENDEKFLAFSKKVTEFSDSSGFQSPLNLSRSKASDMSPDFEDLNKRSVRSLFRSRYTYSAETQTEEKVFLQMMKQDEDEFMDWIMKDRKEHLMSIQKQIFNRKNELSKVNKFFVQHKNMCQSFNFEELELSFNSEESFDISVDADLELLRNSGIIGQEVDLHSWREGYNFGFESKFKGSLSPRSRKNDDSFDIELNDSKSGDPNIFKTKAKKNEENLKRKKNTKFQEFRFQNKELKHSSQKHFTKPKFLENFLADGKVAQAKKVLITKKMVLKTISSIYSAAIAKDENEFEPLHLFVYEEFCSRYGQIRVVNKKMLDLMSAVVVYKDERRVTIFAKLFGISVKVGIPCYSRPREAFNFFVALNKLLETSHFGINVGNIKGKDFIPLIRAVECSRELLLKHFDPLKVLNILNSIEKKSIPDPNKINKRLIDQEILQEMLLEIYNDHNIACEKFITDLMDPFKYFENPSKIHKLDFFMLLRFFNNEKFSSLFGSSPLDYFEEQTDHSRYKPIVSVTKTINLCFQLKLLFPDEIGYKLREIQTENEEGKLSTGFSQEVLHYKLDFTKIFERRESLGLDLGLLNNWEHKILRFLENPRGIQDNMKVLWKVLSSEVKRLNLE